VLSAGHGAMVREEELLREIVEPVAPNVTKPMVTVNVLACVAGGPIGRSSKLMELRQR
jgi:hypothetical protein